MAKVWPVYEGRPATIGEPWAEMSLEDAIRVLDLEPSRFRQDLSADHKGPKFGTTESDRTWAGYRHVVVEIGEEEAKAAWIAGFYVSPLTPVEGYFRLQVHRRLGERWRDEWTKGKDAEGEPAIWLSAVLKADSPESEWALNNRDRIQAEVRQAASESSLSEWIFVRFRKETELRTASWACHPNYSLKPAFLSTESQSSPSKQVCAGQSLQPIILCFTY